MCNKLERHGEKSSKRGSEFEGVASWVGKLPKTQWGGWGRQQSKKHGGTGEGGAPSPVSFLIKLFGKKFNCIKTTFAWGDSDHCAVAVPEHF